MSRIEILRCGESWDFTPANPLYCTLAEGRLPNTATAHVGTKSSTCSLQLGRCHMSRLYGPVHRSLQDRFDTRRLADNVETRVVLTEIPPEHKAFIESRDMFFLSTIDHQGRPTVSYKGGDPGFVRVLGSKTLAFPCYYGNGMFYSMGNLLGNPPSCSSISKSHTDCAFRAPRASMTTIRCCENTPRRSW